MNNSALLTRLRSSKNYANHIRYDFIASIIGGVLKKKCVLTVTRIDCLYQDITFHSGYMNSKRDAKEEAASKALNNLIFD